MRNLLALLLFLPSLCLAQLPDGVPSNGLIAYYGFSNNGLDATGSAPEMLLVGSATYTSDRFGQANSALYPNGGSANTDGPFFDYGWGEPFTFAIWFTRPLNTGGNARLMSTECPEGNFRIGNDAAGQGVTAALSTYMHVGSLSDSWHHLVYTYDGDSTKTVFLDGSFHSEKIETLFEPLNYCNPLALGRKASSASNDLWPGLIDDVGIWDRALDSAEVLALYIGTPPEYGCTDQTACNFDPLANSDDGSCEYGCLYCGEGTVWDSTLAQCISIAPPCAPSCGEGTVWDPVNEECIIAIPADLNYDGCVTVADLLELLAVHGTCPPYPEWPDEPTDTIWTCGEPLTYWDYDYATALIGDQCWFAENLRTALYANGDSIPSGLTDGEWTSTTAGATSVYGEGSSACDNYSPEIDACDELQSLAEYGRLYNLYAAIETRGLCPTGWKVPEDQDWTSLESYVSDEGFSSATGIALKSSSGWFESGNGSNNFQFSANPGGYRRLPSGNFDLTGKVGLWWSSTLVGTTSWGWYRRLRHDSALLESDEPPLNGSAPNNGLSIRCIKD